VPRQLEFRQNANTINRLRNSGVQVGLEIQSAKSAAFTALLNDCRTEHRDLFNAINRLRKSRQSARDKLAHWIWGYSTDIKDGLLLGNPKHLISIMEPFRPFSVDRSNIGDIRKLLERSVYVYKEKDFLQIISANNDMSTYFDKFKTIISGPAFDPNDGLYESLLAVPEISDILRRLDQQGQTLPKGDS
jgi:hypothetical protein